MANPNRHERRKAKSAKKSKAQAFKPSAVQKAFVSMTHSIIDWEDPKVGDVLNVMKTVGAVAESFIASLDAMKDNEAKTIERCLLMMTPEFVVVDEGSTEAMGFKIVEAIEGKTFFAFELHDLSGETTHQVADRFLARRTDVMVAVASMVLTMMATKEGLNEAVADRFTTGHIETIFELIGLPRKKPH
ncbi:hypothetical protein HR059_07430 [Sinorhizobium meliloti WSM1022]|uniref:hypothetical protein n=1 Tax=Rhizobium meliloti TaxID=382 RepID=UPI0003F98501|nr:hypothetical protein [Sinorhizobium meliloti]QKN14304.1 hypothetical protein HR059_07430 [Sinorhizobium meliloti WSM1022]